MAFDVTERVIFVTGAASGIGAGIAEVFAGEGATVIAADLSAERLTDEVDRINGLGLRGTVHATQLDVTDAPSVDRALDAVAATYGGIDVVVNSAGIFIDIDPYRHRHGRRPHGHGGELLRHSQRVPLGDQAPGGASREASSTSRPVDWTGLCPHSSRTWRRKRRSWS